MDYRYRDFLVSGRIAASKWAWAKDEDHHVNTKTVFKDYFNHIAYVTYGAEISYLINDNFSVSLNIDAQQYERTKGDTQMNAPGGYEEFDTGAGIEHYSWMSGLSVEYRF